MSSWWSSNPSVWLLTAVLIGVPVLAAAVFRIARRLLPIDERKAGSTAFRIVSVVILLLSIVEWGIGASQAVVVPQIIASYPDEFWRWVGALAQPVVASVVGCGVGAHAVWAWLRRLGAAEDAAAFDSRGPASSPD